MVLPGLGGWVTGKEQVTGDMAPGIPFGAAAGNLGDRGVPDTEDTAACPVGR